ncbi:MAG TPA: hypothetical protein VGB55_08800 [Tepidisphaeraceae bacterium]|jgi:hypothetical protein
MDIVFFPKRRNPRSNTDRQRDFRERNPGYYGRLHRARRAAMMAAAEARRAGHAEAVRVEAARVPLALPAPVEPFLFVIPTMAELLQQREAVFIERAP